MFIRPKTGIKIRDPLTKLLIPEEGCQVVEDIYWHRRVRDGDAEIIQAPVVSKTPKESDQ